jgi:hypothetical protein
MYTVPVLLYTAALFQNKDNLLPRWSGIIYACRHILNNNNGYDDRHEGVWWISLEYL